MNYLEDTDWARIGNGSFYIYNDEFRQFYIASSPSDKTSAEVFLTEKITEENVIEVLNDPQEKKVRFHFLSSNKYLDVPGGTVETDECLWAYRENGSSAQMWRILKQDDIYYIITQDNNGEYMALTIDVERKKIVLTPFNRTKQQSWRIKPL